MNPQTAKSPSTYQDRPTQFVKGMLLSYDKEEHVVRTVEPDYMVLENTLTHEPKMLKTDVWSLAYHEGFLKVTERENTVAIHPITDAEKLAEAERWLAYLNELDISGSPGSMETRLKVIDSVSKRVSDPNPPHQMKLYRMHKKWGRKGRNIYALLNTKLTRTKPVTEAQYDFAMAVIDEHYLVPHGGNRSALYRTYKEAFYLDINQEKYELCGKPMSKTSLDNLLDELDPFQVSVAQKGLKAARALFRDSNEKIITKHPGQRVEIDAVHLNLGVLCDETGEYLGRIILFLAIDVHTRYILGYSIVYGTKPAESAEAAMNLLRHVLSPKLKNGNFQHDWHTIGTPEAFHSDNGAGFISETVTHFYALLHSSIHRAESGKSQRRPFVERFNRTIREQLMTKIPGYLGKRVDAKDFNKTVEAAAVITLSEFIRYLEEYIVDYYHQNAHKGLDGLSPAQKLAQCVGDFYPRPAADLAMLDTLVGATYTRTIQETQGVQIENLYYNSTELKHLRFKLMQKRNSTNSKSKDTKSRSDKVKVEVIFNKKDISSVTVIVPGEMEMMIVPLRDKTVAPGTSLEAYRAQNQAAKKGAQNAETKTYPSKHGEHGKPKKRKPSSSAPKSKALESGSYCPQTTLEEGVNRFARDNSKLTYVQPSTSVLEPPIPDYSRELSGGR
ncbi:DDE-type integrase/transposase/recombinase [Agarivorans albus]|uniref:Transposase n=1 Tax=Agarivorans albus MKT 106 TaxID=1331007 RepID=R9PTL9_AGAAL|nr:DDE-type integrase/transposase/recombinase [Agarivorans albus]GAD02651.1 transposase [Agarivorans albus MKT 106]